MARNSNSDNTTTSSTAGTTASKRKFGVSTNNIPDAMPTIADGYYIGNLKSVKADAADKMLASWNEVEDLQLFDVMEVIKGKRGERVHTGEFIITGAITYGVELANSPTQELPMDTMTIYNGRVSILFAKDEDGNWGLDQTVDQFGVKNRTFKAFQKAVGLTDDDLNDILEATPFDEDEEVVVPERLEGVEDVESMLQAVMFYKTFFTLLAERVTGVEVKVNISRESIKGSDDLVNRINTGNFGSSCGLLAIEG